MTVPTIANPTFVYFSAFSADELAHPTNLPFSVVRNVFVLFPLLFFLFVEGRLFSSVRGGVAALVCRGIQNMCKTATQEKLLLGE